MRFESDAETDHELDKLIRWSLQSETRDVSPPDRVWQRIQAGLDGGPLAFPEPRERRIGWRGLAQMASVAVAFCLVFGVILTLQLSVSPSGLDGQSRWMSGYAAPLVMTDEDVPSGRLVYMAEREQRHMQRSLSPETDPLLVYRHWRG